jgi:hypothetical protein
LIASVEERCEESSAEFGGVSLKWWGELVGCVQSKDEIAADAERS